MSTRVVPSVGEITHAVGTLDPVFAHSPLLCGTALDNSGAKLALKVETLNPIRSFKGRGATTWLRQVATDAAGVVCASAGNFGQGLAYAARAAGIPCHIFVGASANPAKVQAMRELGARVKVGGYDYDSAIPTARTFAERHGLRFVQDGRDPWIVAGAATMAVEVTDAGVVPDVALVPVGNSALVLGIPRWLRHHSPGTRIVGVCAEWAPAPALSWRRGEPVTEADAGTVADGIGIEAPFPESVAGMVDFVDEMMLVNETRLRSATRKLLEELGLVVEPAGAAGVAALLSDPEPYRNRLVLTPLCGAHLAPEALRWAPGWRD